MPGYAKFLKDLVTKMRAVSIDLTNDVRHCSVISTRSLVKKQLDPGAFTIPCTLRSIKFAKALCDLGANINLMPLDIYQKLGLRVPRPTTMRLMITYRSVKQPMGIICDVLVKVPIILGRPFLARERALVDVHRGELKSKLNKDETNDMNVVSTIEVVSDDEMRVPIEERMAVETLAAGMGAHSYAPKKLGLDLKNRPIPPTKLSIEEPPVLELKQLPGHLRYAFVGTNNSLLVILAADLNDELFQEVIKVLRRYKKGIRWTIADIIRIPPGIYTYRIQPEEDCSPTIEHQWRLNPTMQEVVKKEIIKWLDAGVFYPISTSHLMANVYGIQEDEQVDFEGLLPNAFHGLDSRHEKTTSNCLYGTFGFKNMPSGLCNAPATFQRCIMSIFSDMVEDTLEVFLDDFLVVAGPYKDARKKCHFMLKEGIVLGHKLSQKGIEVDKAKIQVIKKLPPPICVKGVRSFLGHITYQEKATQTEKDTTMEQLLKTIAILCTKVDSMGKEIKQIKTNLKYKCQSHDSKHAELCRSKDEKILEIEGDVGKLPKTHNICSITTVAPVEILYDEIKPPIQVIKICVTKDMIIPKDIEQQSEIQKIEIPSFYANKRIIGISTIIQELAHIYLNRNVIWSYYSRDQLMIYSNSRELRKTDMDEVQIWILSLLKP
ncbi:hypothetical protein H5410_003292 [Solanum commersonii]|uniref:Reverse transcriptase domain-containing protein n=1 Tax=Solanum commersonii TaxID=4109 RepID=A0A9J6B587_SOLCO|nr:hypothetical protein H5410_003292 [Solanum commersonii]